MKDFYDLYYFVKYKWKDVNEKILQKAIKTTFEHRKTEKDLQNFDEIINLIENDETMYTRWKLYQNRFVYAKDIHFKDVIQTIKQLVRNTTFSNEGKK